MWNIFYRNFRLLILTIFLILVWGISSFQLLPRMEDPELSQWDAIINTSFPGASAERVESLVTEKIEQELFEIEEIASIDSTSTIDSSFIVIHVKDNVRNFDQVWSLVRDSLNDVTPRLPPGVLEPEYEEVKPTAYTMIVGLTWDLDTPPNYAILRRLAEQLREEFRSISGTEEVQLIGEPLEEIIVEINPADLSQLKVTPQELSQQIRLSDAKVATGQLRSSRNNLQLEVESELDSLERIRQIAISLGDSGQFARLGDIALVKKGTRDPLSELVLINGNPGVTLAVRIESQERIDKWAIVAHQKLANFRQSIPQEINLEIILDQNHYVAKRFNSLFKNLLLGGLLVLGCTFLMMGWKSALVVSLALPFSILIVFGGMKILGIPLHQISVTGLIIALGLLIDNAIVVVDQLQHLLQQRIKPSLAISKSLSYLAIPLFASNLTTILTFLVIALLPGKAGEFVKTVAVSVILALLSSLFVSFTIVPALIGRMNSGENRSSLSNNKLKKITQRLWNRGLSLPYLTRLYSSSLDFILAKPFWGIVLAFILPINGFLLASTIPEQFFPPAERDQFQIELELSSSASVEKTQSVVEKASAMIRKHPEVSNLHWFLGNKAPEFYYNLPRRGANQPYYAHGIIQLYSQQKSFELISSLQNELNQAFPSARVLVRQLEQGPYIAAPIELRIFGSDLAMLRELGRQVRLVLAQVTGITSTRASLSEALPKLALNLDEEQAKLTGLDNTFIAEQLNANLEGTLGGSVVEDTEEIPVRVRLSNRDRSNLDQITTLDLLPETRSSVDNSAAIPLSAVGKITVVPELSTITRRNGKRVNTIQGFLPADTISSEVLAEFQQKLAASNIKLPPGYSWEFGGEFEERNKTLDNLISIVSILLLLMVVTLVLSFGSFRLAGIIVLVGIGSIGLAFFSLWWFDYPLGFMAILGIVALIGVAINDSIVVMAALRSHPEVRQGNLQAIRDVIVRSTRHVLTTTITTVAGFIPLLLLGSDFWSPLAICVASGVVGATLLALYFVPCAYYCTLSRNRLR